MDNKTKRLQIIVDTHRYFPFQLLQLLKGDTDTDSSTDRTVGNDMLNYVFWPYFLFILLLLTWWRFFFGS